MPVELRIDGRQSQTALQVQRGVCRFLRDAGFAALTEFTLTTGHRADVIGLNGQGALWIVEIKSSLEDFRADFKWPEYRDYCDRLFFAIPQHMDQDIMPATAGLFIADQFGADLLRESPENSLHPSRRKAVTLAFARAAALRLHGLYDPPLML